MVKAAAHSLSLHLKKEKEINEKSNYSLINIFRIFDFIFALSRQRVFSSHFISDAVEKKKTERKSRSISYLNGRTPLCVSLKVISNINFQLIEHQNNSPSTNSHVNFQIASILE